MTTKEFLAYLRNLDIRVWREGDQLRINAPKGVLTSDLRAELAQRKADILAMLPAIEVGAQDTAPPLQPIPRSGDLQLSFAQQRLWFIDQLTPGNPVYNIPIVRYLTGPVDVKILEQCLNEIVRRHETLRTTIPVVNGQPVQHITPYAPFSLPVIDLRELTELDRDEKISQLIAEEAQRPFALTEGPLLRTILIHFAEDSYAFILNMHHIISDGWSIGVFFQELTVLYRAFSDGQPSPLPELPIQYADFASWQRQWLQGEVLDTQLSYWKKQLSDAPSIIELPTDQPRSTVQTSYGAKQSFVLSSSLVEALKALSRQANVTLFMTLLAAFKTLLHRYSGQEDIVVGSPIANRNRTEIEGLIGFFVNTLVLRTSISDNLSFRDLLGRIREVTLDAYAHQDLPFEKLVETLRPERNLSHTPLFQVMFILQNAPKEATEDSRLIMNSVSIDNETAKFDLTLTLEEANQKLYGKLVYNADVFSWERMAEMAGQFEYLLEQIVELPDKPIHAYSLQTPQSRQILPDPGIPLPEPEQIPLPQMIKKRAQQTPDQLAVIQDKTHYTYAQLDERASILAQHLISTGLQQGDVVAVCGPRSFELISAMIAVFMSGGVLLSIDHTLPDQRKRIMLREADAKALIHTGNNQQDMSWAGKILPKNILSADKTPENPLISEHTINLSSISFPNISGDDPAYIFFTSGTTGVPKGVLGNHKGLSHFLSWQRDTFGIQPQDRAAQLTALSFDVVLRDVFLPLVSGATLCLPQDNIHLDAQEILQWLQQSQISVIHTVPTLAQNWLTHVPAGISLPDLRWVFFAGEPLSDTLVHQWRENFPHGHIVNLYGPTETTMAKCFYQVPADPLPGIQPVGNPMPQTQALVLNKKGQICGIGEVGEIVIRTPFRTLGYVNAPEENLKKFIKNPFRNDARDQIYFTGDQGRYRPDGLLEILGRIDGQVKIRGIRIETAEVASFLTHHPDVASCTVIARKDNGNGAYLAAYVVPKDQKQLTISELRTHLQQNLLPAMVPGAFVFLQELPRTSNGKIDRRLLPEPDQTQLVLESASIAPRNTIEKQLVDIWEDILGIEPIGVTDNFFDLGGHSLLAVHVFSQINRVFNVNLPLATLFRQSTIEHLAEEINRQDGIKPWSPLVKIEPESSGPPFFCVHGITGDILWFRDLAHCLSPDCSFYGLQARGLDGIQEPFSDIKPMAAYYIDHIRLIQPNGPYYLGGASFGGTVALEMAQQLLAQGEEVAELAIFDHSPPNIKFEIAQGEFKRKLTRWIKISKNFPYWLRDFLRLGPARMWARVRRKLRITGKTFNQPDSNPEEHFDALDIIDYASELPDHRRQLITSHFQAVTNYIPQPYPGNVTLFRAKSRPLLRTFDPEISWQQLAPGRVDVRDVPGSHEGIFKEPHVHQLAGHLKICMNQNPGIKQPQ